MTFTFDDLGNPEATTEGFAPFGEFQTWYRITADGRRALERYLDHMEALIQAMREK